VTAAKKNELKAHLWNFPFVGSVPYKGFFKKEDATKEADLLRAQELDVMVRGVSAYSTLGWFSDPLLSSMTQDDDFSFVDTLIHESTHATIYIKSNANFNERLATFVGEKGAEEFFNLKEGSKSVTLEKARAERQDAKVFFSFMTEEIKKLEAFYKEKGHQPEILSLREQEFKNIHLRFAQNCRPKLKTKRFDFFSSMTLNNALLVGYSLYYSNLEIFEKLMAVSKNNWKLFFDYLNQVKDLKDPEEALTGLIVKEATVTSPSPSPSSPSPSS
jgi:predicted aminopeptidase